MGDGGWFWGESFLLGGGREGGKGGLFVVFVYLLTIPLVGISLLVFFSSFSFSFRERRFLRIIFYFFFFSAFSIF